MKNITVLQRDLCHEVRMSKMDVRKYGLCFC